MREILVETFLRPNDDASIELVAAGGLGSSPAHIVCGRVGGREGKRQEPRLNRGSRKGPCTACWTFVGKA